MALILATVGEDKTGKTTVELSFPTPMVIFESDIATVQRAIHRFPGTKYYINRMTVPEQDLKAELKKPPDYLILQYPTPVGWGPKKERPVGPVWDTFVDDYKAVLSSPKIMSVGIDTASKWWWMCHTAYLQQLQKASPERERLLPVEYGEPNNRMASVIYAARQYGKNMCLTHHLRFKYKDVMTDKGVQSIQLSEQEPDGFKHSGSLIDVEMWLEKGQVTIDVNGEDIAGMGSIGTITLSGLSFEMEGMKLENPTFQSIMELAELYRGDLEG